MVPSSMIKCVKAVGMKNGKAINITDDAKIVFGSLLHYAGETLVKAAVDLSRFDGRTTVAIDDMKTAVALSMGRMIAAEAIEKGDKHVNKFNIFTKNKKLKKTKGGNIRLRSPSPPTPHASRGKNAGLLFSPARFDNRIKAHNFRKGTTVGVFGAAVLQYLCEEIADLAYDEMIVDNKNQKTISPRHINLAIESDAGELGELFKKVLISRGGVVPSQRGSGPKKYSTPLKFSKTPNAGSIKKLVRRSGIDRSGADVIPVVQKLLSELLYNILAHGALPFMMRDQRKTLTESDARRALLHLGQTIAGKGNTGKVFKVIRKVHAADDKKTRTKKPGVRAKMDIRASQKSVGHILSRAFVKKSVKDMAEKLASEYGYAKKPINVSLAFLNIIHAAIEDYAVKLLQDAHLVTVRSKRAMVVAKDVKLVVKIREGKVLSFIANANIINR